jgi:hypothetical protein
MLDFTFASSTPFPTNENFSRAETGNVRRAAVDRRQVASAIAHKRRRHDGMNSGKQPPLQWESD